MVKYKLSTDFSSNRFTDKELNVKVDVIVIRMTDNSNFPTPTPSIATVKDVNDRFAQALVKVEDGAKQDTVNKRMLREELELLLQQLGLYVQLNSGNNEAIIISSGFDMNKKPAPVGILDKPENLKIKPDANKGTLNITWEPVEHANFYEVRYTEFPSSTSSAWNVHTTTKHRIRIDGLTSGKQYIFKVTGAGANSLRIWSDEVISYVL